MEKNRIRPVKSGRTFRMSYSKSNEVLEIPNLIAIQKDSYQWFLGDGLKEVFDDISPIVDFSGMLPQCLLADTIVFYTESIESDFVHDSAHITIA